MTEPCPDYLEAVSTYLDGALAPAEEQRVHAHLRACPACSRLVVDLVPVLAALRTLPAPPPPAVDPWPALAARLRAEGGFRRVLLFPRLPRRAGWVAASVLMLAVGSGLYLGNRGADAPLADADTFRVRHERFLAEESVPMLVSPEFSVIEAGYPVAP